MRFESVTPVSQEFLRSKVQFEVVKLELQFCAVAFQVPIGIVPAFPGYAPMRNDRGTVWRFALPGLLLGGAWLLGVYFGEQAGFAVVFFFKF